MQAEDQHEYNFNEPIQPAVQVDIGLMCISTSSGALAAVAFFFTKEPIVVGSSSTNISLHFIWT